MTLLIDEKTISELKLLQLKSKKRFLTQRHGRHHSLKRGRGFDFADHGSYQAGDDIRYIDWNIFARSDKLYIKHFQEEEDLRVISIIDNSESMQVDDKYLTSSKLTYALAHIAIMQGDRFHFSFENDIPLTFTSYSQLTKLNSYLLKPKKKKSSRSNNLSNALKYPGVVFYFSDFLFPLIEANNILNSFLIKNMDVIFVQVLSENERSLDNLPRDANLIDSETGNELKLSIKEETKNQYKDFLNAHINSLSAMCASNQVSFISVNSNQGTIDILRNVFLTKGLLEY